MKLVLNKFGDILVSRPAGREAWLVAKAYTLPKDINESIEVDFSGIKVLTPSWADEFITKLLEEYKDVDLLDNGNATVGMTLRTLKESGSIEKII